MAVRVQIEKDIITISIDTSGPGLNKRGYRLDNDQAALRETLAAGLVLLSRYKPEQDTLYDPFCGTGTLLIEAGLIAKNMAPGLNRDFAAEERESIPLAIWDKAQEEAEDLMTPKAPFEIHGSDINTQTINIAENAIKRVGLTEISLKQAALKDIQAPKEKGKLICNPPYGKRLGDTDSVQELYEDMGDIFKTRFKDWDYYIITTDKHFETPFGQKATKKRKVFNGGMESTFYSFF